MGKGMIYQTLKVIFYFFRTMGTYLVCLVLLFNAVGTILSRVKCEVSGGGGLGKGILTKM